MTETFLNFFTELSILNIFFDTILRVISSIIFLLLVLNILGPKIKISPNICHSKLPLDSNKNPNEEDYFYVFKIVNNSFFPVYDIEIILNKMVPHMTNNGDKINRRSIQLKTNVTKVSHLPRKRKKEGYGDHAYQLRTDENLTKIIKDKNIKLVLSVKSKHGLSNLSRVVTQEFNSENSIHKDAEFKFGTDLVIHS